MHETYHALYAEDKDLRRHLEVCVLPNLLCSSSMLDLGPTWLLHHSAKMPQDFEVAEPSNLDEAVGAESVFEAPLPR